MVVILYALLFLSGAAGLVYEVTWARSLTLVFGGSHLAVTTVLSVYMGGLALGAALLGRRADESRNPLRLYGILEMGVALFALLFIGLTRIYPSLYVPLARLAEHNRVWLSILRVSFGVAAMVVPTTLMGGTLPVLTRFAAARTGSLGRHLSFLYGFNTLGAVAGSLAAGFVLLRTLGVTATILAAAATNLLLGLAAVALSGGEWAAERREPEATAPPPRAETPAAAAATGGDLAHRLVLWGAAVSGFCALGYEVLWTRLLSMVVGTSVYSFTIMLVAFLTGIALGSEAYGLAARRSAASPARPRPAAGFGLVQVAIGLAALAVTVLMRDLPTHATRLQGLLLAPGASEFGARQGASFAVAFAYMLVPAFFMGVALPLAGAIHAVGRERVGGAVGSVFTWNTTGSILGAALSGFVLVYAFGIERSLQMLVVLNVGFGLALLASLAGRRAPPWAVAAGTAALLAARAWDPGWGRAWDMKYFAIFRNNQREAFDTKERIEDALANTDVLYYFEGANETISVIRPRGSMQAFVVNGRPEASTALMDVQCQRTLGHLPMLLHPNPRRVFVLGTGTGMTLGATSIHPEVERIVLAEIEPGAIGAARTFGEWNHRVIDDPRLRIVYDDGRNYLRTTDAKFDVITADPIHPWSGGAAYLYTREYFQSVAAHLAPGGIAAQWLPIYELTPRDIRTVVRTFAEAFRHVAVWLTHYDAELVGSGEPIAADEARLTERLARPEMARDLQIVDMGTAEDFLSYFALGDAGARAFGRDGDLNTDDNLVLEFSAPESQGVGRVVGDNLTALAASRESLLPHLTRPAEETQQREQRERWDRNLAAARIYDRAHALFFWGLAGSDAYRQAESALESRFPRYAPFRFLRREESRLRAWEPRLADAVGFPVITSSGSPRLLQVSAVTMRVGDTRAAVVFVDNDRREIYGQRYFDGSPGDLEGTVARYAAEVLQALRSTYAGVADDARRRGAPAPAEAVAVERLKERVAVEVARPSPR